VGTFEAFQEEEADATEVAYRGRICKPPQKLVLCLSSNNLV